MFVCCVFQSHHEEGEGEISEGEPEAEDSSDEGRGALEHRDLLDRLRLHRPDKVDLRVSHIPTSRFSMSLIVHSMLGNVKSQLFLRGLVYTVIPSNFLGTC